MKWHWIHVGEISTFPWNTSHSVSVLVFASVYSCVRVALLEISFLSFPFIFFPHVSFQLFWCLSCPPEAHLPLLILCQSMLYPARELWMSCVQLGLHVLGCVVFFLSFWMRGGVDFVPLTISCDFSSWSNSKRPFGTIRLQKCCRVWISSRQILIKHAAIQKSSLKAEKLSIWFCIQGRKFQAFKTSYNFIFLQLSYSTGWDWLQSFWVMLIKQKYSWECKTEE